jgi:hypothetical protein
LLPLPLPLPPCIFICLGARPQRCYVDLIARALARFLIVRSVSLSIGALVIRRPIVVPNHAAVHIPRLLIRRINLTVALLILRIRLTFTKHNFGERARFLY